MADSQHFFLNPVLKLSIVLLEPNKNKYCPLIGSDQESEKKQANYLESEIGKNMPIGQT